MFVCDYELSSENNTLRLPKGAKVLSAGVARGKIFIWVLMDSNSIYEDRYFGVVKTGQTIPAFNIGDRGATYHFIGTVAPDDVTKHVFERSL